MKIYQQEDILDTQGRIKYYTQRLNEYYQEADELNEDILEDLGDTFFVIRKEQEYLKQLTRGKSRDGGHLQK